LVPMPLDLEGKRFYTMGEVAEMAGVARQTVWRWKESGKVPSGVRYRGRELLFTLDEVETICDYAHRLEPAQPSSDLDETN